MRNISLEDYLLENGLLTRAQIEEIKPLVDEGKGITTDKILAERGLVSEAMIVRAKSSLKGYEIVNVDEAEYDPNVVKLLTREQALKYHCIPVKYDEFNPNLLMVVMEDPESWVANDDLRLITGLEIISYIGEPSAILKKIEELYPDPNQKTVQAEPKKKAIPTVSANGMERYDVSEEWAHSGIIKAGNFYYLGYCVGNVGGTIEEQINGAFDHMEKRLAMVGLTLENVIQMDCLFRDVWNIPVMEAIIKKRFNGKYPVRKSIQTNFAHVGGLNGLLFQADGVAYAEK
ncbi:MAG: hypothetical protein II139_09700 [Lachnospiraceae bacterium]|nr:hypothetical protein [Lachnospiraceae bacterium]